MESIFLSKSLKDTSKVAKLLFRKLSKGGVLCLTGDLGAGKTTFTKALMKYFGVKEVVSSPTFTIVKQYLTKRGMIAHFDLYRINDDKELYEIGFDEIIANNFLSIIEWPQIAKSILPASRVEVSITFDQEGNRIFKVEDNNE